jgi:hypothetical protein
VGLFVLSSRNPVLVDMQRELAARSAIIGGEVVAGVAAGVPDFGGCSLRLEKPAQLDIWAFRARSWLGQGYKARCT